MNKNYQAELDSILGLLENKQQVNPSEILQRHLEPGDVVIYLPHDGSGIPAPPSNGEE